MMRRMKSRRRFQVSGFRFQVDSEAGDRNSELSCDGLRPENLRLIRAISLGLLLLSLTGCGFFGPRPDSSRFFALTSLAEAEAVRKSPGAENLSLGVGPVRLPGYLDRDELVTRLSQNRFAVAENDRWIEPLEENAFRVLMQNLTALLRPERIARYPWQSNQRPTYQVEIEILRFEPNADYEVQLRARWAVIDADTKQARVAKESHFTRQAKTKSSEAAVAAMSEALGDLSREIADAVGAVARAQKP